MRAYALALSLSLPLALPLFGGGLTARAQAPAPAPAPAGDIVMNVIAADSQIDYHVVHPLHKVNGKSKKVTGTAKIFPSGKAQVTVSVDAGSFDSGNANRDAHVKEVIEAAKHDKVEIKAAGDGITIPTSFPATVEKTFKVQINFHGIDPKPVVDVPVKITFESATRVRAQATIQLSLDSFKVERPSLMFKKVDDALKIEANVVFGK